MKTGYVWKEIICNDDYECYNGETIYNSYNELIDSILNRAMEFEKKYRKEFINSLSYIKKYKIIKDEILKSVSKCKNSLSVCNSLKKSLQKYEETCDMEVSIYYICIFG